MRRFVIFLAAIALLLAAGSVAAWANGDGGTVEAVGSNSPWGQCDVSGWTDVVQVAAGRMHTVGVKSDGTVAATGWDIYDPDWVAISGWSNIKEVAAGNNHTVGLKYDGSVVAAGYSWAGALVVGSWSDIVQVAAGNSSTVGLRDNGTVVATWLNNYGQANVSSWTGIDQVAAGYAHTVGLRDDGTVVATGWNDYGQCNVSSWTGIIEVAAGWTHTVGLKDDGTVVATGRNDYGQCNLSSWTDVDQVAAGQYHTVALVVPQNQPPVAEAGPDQPVDQTSDDGAEVTLDGSASSDPDGDPLTYEWTWDGGSASGAVPSAVFDVGSHEVTLTVSDGVASSTDTVLITVAHVPPIAEAGDDQLVMQTNPTGAEVTLDGSGSSDLDSVPLTYEWTWSGGSASGPSLTVSLPVGTTTEFTLQVYHDPSCCASDTVSVTVTEVTMDDLRLLVEERADAGGIDEEMETSLLAKIDAALEALAKGNPNDAKVAVNDLKALINQVEAQTDKKISTEAAAAIIDGANLVIANLGD